MDISAWLPDAATWILGQPLQVARTDHTATLLPDGDLLIIGGKGRTGRLASAERYTPYTHHLSTLSPLHHGRADHTATLLASGEVLIAGGTSDRGSGILRSAVLFDRRTNCLVSARRMVVDRAFHTATTLLSGGVLVVGGSSALEPSAELYDHVANRWVAVAPPAAKRSWHTATLLQDDRVLVVGGRLGSGPGAEIYDPRIDVWIPTAPPIEDRRVYHASTTLLDGRVLVVGGTDKYSEFTASAEIYAPHLDRWTAVESLDYRVMAAQATLLSSGQVLLTGGIRYDEQARDGCITPNTRLYDPNTATWQIGPPLQNARFGHTAVALDNGNVLVAGGLSSPFSVLDAVEYLGPC